MSVAICGFNVYLYGPPKNPLRKKDRSFSSGMNFFTSKNESESRHKKQILVHTVASTIQSLEAWLILFLGQCGR